MHPAYSLIFFTTASGLGYGLLALMGIFAALGLMPAGRVVGFAGFAVALGLVTLGLLSSTFHLGHPERAWRAVTQWKSSWLSREGVMAIVTYIPAGLFAFGWLFFETLGGFWRLAAVATAVCCALTVYCTAMIYASIAAVPRWHHPLVPPGYLIFALATGALALDALLRVFGHPRLEVSALAALAVIAALVVKLLYWRSVDNAPARATADSATGLAKNDIPGGIVRLLDSPHVEKNYLQTEMGYKVARKHAGKLRRMTVLFAFLVPLVLVVLTTVLPPGAAAAASVTAAAAGAFGIVLERWLFFAEAQHVVMLYYGERAI